ncbi:hypothetical protein Tco_1491918 [Tanacetum coccineum]
MAYLRLHSPKATKKTTSIRRIQRRPIRRIGDMKCEDSRRYQMWSLLQETPDTPYPSQWIHLRCNLYESNTEYDVNMDDPNITMEEYIRLEEEKVRRHAIVFDDAFTSEVTPSCEPTVSPLNDNKIDFRISFDESDDEDYTPTVSYFDDLDFFKDFENEFSAIVCNDALTSKSYFLTEPTISPQHIDECNLKGETSLSECDEKEQNILHFNDLIPFNVIYPDDSKFDKDNDDDDKIDIKNSSRVIMEYLVKVSKRHAFSSLNKDILKINDSDYQYTVSIKEDMAYLRLHSPKATKETTSIRRIQKRPIRRIRDMECEDSGRYQTWSQCDNGEFAGGSGILDSVLERRLV